MLTAIRSLRRQFARKLTKRGDDTWRGDRRGGGEGEVALIKSNNPHLAGGEKHHTSLCTSPSHTVLRGKADTPTKPGADPLFMRDIFT